MEEAQEKDWIENLSERRFLRYFISYVVIAWGLIQAIDWLVKRYDWNHGLTEGVLIFFVALVPAVLLFIYHHGKPGIQTWKPIEKWGIPLNLVVALGLGGFFGVSHVDATEPVTETVTYVDEDGEEKERLVYNRSLHNRVMLYPPKKVGGAYENDDLAGLALMELLENDLELDNRMYALPPWNVSDEMQSKGIAEFDDLSFTLKRKFAADQYVDYFIDGEMSKENDSYNVTITAYSTADGKEVLSKQYTNNDLMTIADGFSADFNNYLYNQIDGDEAVITFVDLPVSELMTDDVGALFDYIKSIKASNNNDQTSQLNYLNQALEKDPSFFAANSDKGAILFAIGQASEGVQVLEYGMNLLDEQPERTQLGYKSMYYAFTNEFDKGTRLAEMWQRLYPQNEEAYHTLGNFYRYTGEIGKYLDTYQKGYDNGLKGRFLLTLGEQYTQREEFDKALKYLEEFQELYPEKTGEISQLGTLYLKQGNFEKSIAYFEDRVIKDDQKYSNYIALGDAYLKQGNFDKARMNFETSLAKAKIASDSVSVMANVVNLDFLEGKADEYIAGEKNRINLTSRYMAPMGTMSQYMNILTISRFYDCHEADFINARLDEMGQIDMGGIDFKCILNYNKAISIEDTTLIKESRIACPDDIEKATSEIQLKLLGAIENSMFGNYESARGLLNEYLIATNAPRFSFNPFIANMDIKTENWDEAIKLMEYFVERDRSNAEAYVLLGKAYKGDRQNKKAQEAFDKALDIWKNADADFKPLIELKELLEES